MARQEEKVSLGARTAEGHYCVSRARAQQEWEGVGGASGWQLKPSGPRKLGWNNSKGILLCLDLVLCNPPQ